MKDLLHLYVCLTVISFIAVSTAVSEKCTSENELRLVGGQTKFEGRLEICFDKTWHTVCNHYKQQTKNAQVVCRQLGYSNREATILQDDTYSEGAFEKIYSRVIECSGRENRLSECISSPDIGTCTHTRDIGIHCSPSDCSDGEVRLANSTAGHAGRVEVCISQQWGSVCDDKWDRNDAAVVCKQLGLSPEEAISISFGYFGQAKIDPILMDNVECAGDEANITECNYTGTHNCKHKEDAGVICKAPCVNGNIQLVSNDTSHRGQLEVCVNQIWTSVCDKNWTNVDATVACRQMGYPGNGHTPINITNDENDGLPIALGNLECSGQEKRLVDCRVQFNSYSGYRRCDHTNLVGVICNQHNAHNHTTDEPPTMITPDSRQANNSRGLTTLPVGHCSDIIMIILAVLVALLLILLIAMVVVCAWLVVKLKKKSKISPRAEYSNVYEDRQVDNPIYGSTDGAGNYTLLGQDGAHPPAADDRVYEEYEVPPSGQ